MSLQKIQERLVCKKTQYNKFGGYYYRNQEDILEALKPLLAEYGYILNIQDEIVLIGERYYIKATVTIMENDKCIGTATAFAREPAEKKGMDSAQVTGATSSYARKYALNGLLAIDDTKDADSHKPDDGTESSPGKSKPINKDQAAQIRNLIAETNSDETKFLSFMGVPTIEEIPVADFNKAIGALNDKKSGKKNKNA